MKVNLKHLVLILISSIFSSFCYLCWAAPQLITGAGASFPYPLYAKWFSEYRNVDKTVEINYQSVGSGGGIRQFLAGTTDFGATDAPMTDDEIKQAKNKVFHIPMTLGAVAIAYNLPAATEPLQLTPEVLAEIFMGKIKMWDDPKIKALNPKIQFPPKQFIIAAHRSDGSGTTAVFTDYLSTAYPEWKKTIGSGKDVKFPGGLGGKGNEGVTGLIRQSPGAIGYVEMNYAITNKFAMAAIKNGDGQFVLPSTESVSAAAEGSLKSIPADYRVSIVNAKGKKSYPISAFTYLLVAGHMEKAKGQKILDFLKWAMGPGQTMSAALQYAPLPPSLVKRVDQTLKTIELK